MTCQKGRSVGVLHLEFLLFLDLQKHVTTKSQLEAQELENKNVKDVSIHLYFSKILLSDY